MPKITEELIRECYKETKDGPSIKINNKQIITIKDLGQLLVHPEKLNYLDLSFNSIRSVENCFDLLTGLTFLDLSTNLLTEFAGLENLKSLTILRLSRNRINKISSLESAIKLNALDLSMNQITRIENINHLTNMKYLYLYGNQITNLEGIHKLNKLKELRIEQNLIQDINILSLMDSQIIEIQAHSNRISNLDDVIVALSHLPKLKILSLYNNPVADDPTYRFRILKYKQIQNLDGLLVKDYIREVLEDIEYDYDLDQIVIKSQSSINELIERERQLKDSAVTLMKKQVTQIEDDFIEFARSMELELEQLNEYAAIIRTKKHLGEDVAKDKQQLSQWRNHINQLWVSREESLRQRELKMEQERQNYLKNKRQAVDFSGRLYEIAQANPKKWREIKEDMWRKRLELETKNISSIPALFGLVAKGVKNEDQTVDPEMQVDIASRVMGQVVDDLGGQMASEAAVRLEDAENKAIDKLLETSKAKREEKKKGSKACLVF